MAPETPARLPSLSGARAMYRQRGNDWDGSSLNETLTSQRATRARTAGCLFGERGGGRRPGTGTWEEEQANAETTCNCATLFPGVWTDDAGRLAGELGDVIDGLADGTEVVWRKTLEQAAPLPVGVNTTVSSIWAFSGARPQILTHLTFLLSSPSSHRQTDLVECMNRVK